MDLIFKKSNNREELYIHDGKNLSEQNLLVLQHQIIREWKNKKERSVHSWILSKRFFNLSLKTPCSFFLRYSGQGLSILAAIGGIYINNHYRTKLKLGSYGRVSSYLPIVALPAITTNIIHSVVVQPDFMMQKQPCAMCTQIKGGLLHASLAIAYPMVLSPLASFMVWNSLFSGSFDVVNNFLSLCFLVSSLPGITRSGCPPMATRVSSICTWKWQNLF